MSKINLYLLFILYTEILNLKCVNSSENKILSLNFNAFQNYSDDKILSLNFDAFKNQVMPIWQLLSNDQKLIFDNIILHLYERLCMLYEDHLSEINNNQINNNHYIIDKIDITSIINTKPMIIIIRGPASSGKSTISKKLIEQLFIENKTIFTYFTTEDFFLFQMLHKNYLVSGNKNKEGFSIVRDINGDIIEFKASELCTKLYMRYPLLLTEYVNFKLNIIIDGNLLTPESLNDILKLIPENYHIKIISLETSLNTLEEREKSRGDRDIGFSRFQYEQYKKSMNIKPHITDNKNIHEITYKTDNKNTDKIVFEIKNFIKI